MTCSSAIICNSCQYPSVFYQSQCLASCPSQTILNSNSQCVSCDSVVEQCSTCNSTGYCFTCFSPYIYFNGKCYSECPTGYVYSEGEGTCITIDENAEK